MDKIEFDNGEAGIDKEVIHSIALLSCKEALGIKDGEEIGTKGSILNCYADLENGSIIVSLSVKLRTHYPVSDTSFEIQTSIKKAIESMTSCSIKAINISVDGILYDKKHN